MMAIGMKNLGEEIPPPPARCLPSSSSHCSFAILALLPSSIMLGFSNMDTFWYYRAPRKEIGPVIPGAKSPVYSLSSDSSSTMSKLIGFTLDYVLCLKTWPSNLLEARLLGSGLASSLDVYKSLWNISLTLL